MCVSKIHNTKVRFFRVRSEDDVSDWLVYRIKLETVLWEGEKMWKIALLASISFLTHSDRSSALVS